MVEPLPYSTITELNDAVTRLRLEFPRASTEQITDMVVEFVEQLLHAHVAGPLSPTVERLARSRLTEASSLHTL